MILQNHGVSEDLISRALDGSKKFFALGEEEKRKYHLAGLGGARGYTGFGVETAKGSTKYDLKEFWHLGRDLPPGHRYQDKMPPNVDVKEGDFSGVTKEIFTALDALGGRVLEALAVHLGWPAPLHRSSTAPRSCVYGFGVTYALTYYAPYHLRTLRGI